MKALLTSLLFGLSLFIFQGGQLKTIQLFQRKLPKHRNRKNKNRDQEFLAYLWNLKSLLSTGFLPSNLAQNPPNHFLANRLAIVLRIGSDTGTALTPLLNRFIKQVKYQIELQQEVASELASTKATVFVLASLPIFGVILSIFIGANAITWLTQTSIGRYAFGFGVLLNVLGWLWVNRIIKNALSS